MSHFKEVISIGHLLQVEFKDTNVGFSLKGKNKHLIKNNRGVTQQIISQQWLFPCSCCEAKSIKQSEITSKGMLRVSYIALFKNKITRIFSVKLICSTVNTSL